MCLKVLQVRMNSAAMFLLCFPLYSYVIIFALPHCLHVLLNSLLQYVLLPLPHFLYPQAHICSPIPTSSCITVALLFYLPPMCVNPYPL